MQIPPGRSTDAGTAEASVRLELPPLLRVPANKPVEMKCEFALPRQTAAAGDSPTAIEVQWRRDDDDSPVTREWKTPDPKGVLECIHMIDAVQIADEGTYCCSVQPDGSQEPLSTSTLLLVLPAAPVTQRSKSSEKTCGSNSKRIATTERNSSPAKKLSSAADSGDAPSTDEDTDEHNDDEHNDDEHIEDEPLTCPLATNESLLQIVCEPAARPVGMNSTQESLSDSRVAEAADPFECAPETVLQSRFESYVDQQNNWLRFARGAFNDLPQKLRRKRALRSIEDFQVLIALQPHSNWFFFAVFITNSLLFVDYK